MRCRHLLILCLLPAVLCFTKPAEAQPYQIKSTFGDTATCDTVTRGIYIAWFRKGQTVRNAIASMLDSMMMYRDLSLNRYGLKDPPNVRDGYYFNIYMPLSKDSVPVKPGNGVGTDANDYPYMTLNIGNQVNGFVNVAHETFHIFQYGNSSPGFSYKDDSQWFIEASANWFAAVVNPVHADVFVEGQSLVKVPHLPVWLSYNNYPKTWPNTWQRYVHQYAQAAWLFYLTERAGVSGLLFTEGFNSGTTELPQEYLYNRLGGEACAGHFADYAMHMTNRFDFLLPNQVTRLEKEFKNVAAAWDDKQFVLSLSDSGSGGWVQVPDSIAPRAWSFNTLKLRNTADTTYQFDVVANAFGSAGTPARFLMRILVQSKTDGARFISPEMDNAATGSYRLKLSPNDTTVYVNIVSVPQMFRNVNQVFPYKLRITRGTAAEPAALKHLTPDSAYSAQVVYDTIAGVRTAFTAGPVQVRYHNNSNKTLKVTNVTVLNDTTLVARLVLPYPTPAGNYHVAVIRGASDTLQQTDAFRVMANPAPPALVSVNPALAVQGDKIPVSVVGTHTHFLTDTAGVQFYFLPPPGGSPDQITLSEIAFRNDTLIQAQMEVGKTALPGKYTLRIWNSIDDTLTLPNGVEVKMSTGLQLLDEAVCLYPNPVKSILQLTLPAGFSSSTAAFSITELTGREVMHQPIPPTSLIDLTALAPGTYLLTLYNGEGMIRKKLVRE